jgi:hypothetical protein
MALNGGGENGVRMRAVGERREYVIGSAVPEAENRKARMQVHACAADRGERRVCEVTGIVGDRWTVYSAMDVDTQGR